MCVTAAACETVRMSSSPASNQPPTFRPGMCSPGLYCVSVVGPILKPSKCWWLTGAWRASSMCDSPCQTRYASLTNMWSICTGNHTSSVCCQVSA